MQRKGFAFVAELLFFSEVSQSGLAKSSTESQFNRAIDWVLQ